MNVSGCRIQKKEFDLTLLKYKSFHNFDKHLEEFYLSDKLVSFMTNQITKVDLRLEKGSCKRYPVKVEREILKNNARNT